MSNPSRGGGDLAGKNILNRGRCLRCSQAGLVDTGCDCFQTFFGPFPVGRYSKTRLCVPNNHQASENHIKIRAKHVSAASGVNHLQTRRMGWETSTLATAGNLFALDKLGLALWRRPYLAGTVVSFAAISNDASLSAQTWHCLLAFRFGRASLFAFPPAHGSRIFVSTEHGLRFLETTTALPLRGMRPQLQGTGAGFGVTAMGSKQKYTRCPMPNRFPS